MSLYLSSNASAEYDKLSNDENTPAVLILDALDKSRLSYEDGMICKLRDNEEVRIFQAGCVNLWLMKHKGDLIVFSITKNPDKGILGFKY